MAISPDAYFLNNLRKACLSRLYMPLWTYDELLSLKRLRWPMLKEESLARLVNLFGPVPQQVFELAYLCKDELATQCDEIESANLTVFRIARIDQLGFVSDKLAGSNKVFHLQVGRRKSAGALNIGRDQWKACVSQGAP